MRQKTNLPTYLNWGFRNQQQAVASPRQGVDLDRLQELGNFLFSSQSMALSVEVWRSQKRGMWLGGKVPRRRVGHWWIRIVFCLQVFVKESRWLNVEVILLAPNTQLIFFVVVVVVVAVVNVLNSDLFAKNTKQRNLNSSLIGRNNRISPFRSNHLDQTSGPVAPDFVQLIQKEW